MMDGGGAHESMVRVTRRTTALAAAAAVHLRGVCAWTQFHGRRVGANSRHGYVGLRGALPRTATFC